MRNSIIYIFMGCVFFVMGIILIIVGTNILVHRERLLSHGLSATGLTYDCHSFQGTASQNSGAGRAFGGPPNIDAEDDEYCSYYFVVDNRQYLGKIIYPKLEDGEKCNLLYLPGSPSVNGAKVDLAGLPQFRALISGLISFIARICTVIFGISNFRDGN